MVKRTFVVQYLSVRGNQDSDCPPGKEFDLVWADSDGMVFPDWERAYRALAALLARNPDFPPSEWRVIKRTVTEEVTGK